MQAKITRKQQVVNIIEWLNSLPNFKKTVRRLGRRTGPDTWEYCCLGVACRIQDLPDVDFEDGVETKLIDTLCLHGHNADFDKPVRIELPKDKKAKRFEIIRNLVNSNDEIFGNDTGFANQRAFMLLTTNRWISNKKVLEEVNRHFATERKLLAKTAEFKILK